LRNLIPVEGRPGLYRDESSNAIINKNKSGANAARAARQNALKKELEVEQLKADVSEIKLLLKELLERQ